MTSAWNRTIGTADLEGLAGHIGPAPEDFQVTEIPAYLPSGQGDHCFVRIRKRGVGSPEAAARLARAARVPVSGVGMAGMKDRWAVAEQWMSLPDTQPESMIGWMDGEVEVLEAMAHPHKLRTGHLRGNRFSIRLVESRPWDAVRAGALEERIASMGLVNLFGPQRFGRDSDNAAHGIDVLLGRRAPRDRRQRRLLVSALQSALFNDYLLERFAWDQPLRPRRGEILERLSSGGLFPCGSPEEDEPRIRQGEVSLTGPIFGARMRRPEPGSEAEALENAVLQGAGLGREAFDSQRKLAPGSRRPLLVRVEGLTITPLAEEGTLRVDVTLPPGVYATVLLHELTHTPVKELRSPGVVHPEEEIGLPPGSS